MEAQQTQATTAHQQKAKKLPIHIHVCGYESPGDTECVELPAPTGVFPDVFCNGGCMSAESQQSTKYVPTIAELCPPEVGCHFETLPGSDEERVANAAIFAFAHIGPTDIPTTQPTVTAMVEDDTFIHGCDIHIGEQALTINYPVKATCGADGWLTLRAIAR
jgi:hypothetical protein